jgi:hypothetical protein
MSGTVFYSGPSALDGRPIVAIATDKTTNRKTGPMVQTWILRRDIDPLQAIATGKDASICGGCYHRGDASTGRPRTCYVTVAQAPLGIWRAYKRGRYSRGPLPADGRPIRLGAYGDPVAVPWQAWNGLHESRLWTGYTHQWRQLVAAPFRNVLMASCDNLADAAEAARLGWRTFLAHNGEPPAGSIECPADSRGAQCASCGLCSGLQRPDAPSIWIRPHGTAARFVGAR